jgi:Uma2 family endonuclease
VATLPFLTPEQYLEIERRAEFKSEYWKGQMYAMAGGTGRHSEAGMRLGASMIARLGGKRCGVFNSDLRIRDSAGEFYTYPDLSLVCGKPEFGPGHTLLNPTVLAEVLSPSTEAHDRGFKFERYQHLKSLREYVLVSQTTPRVETYLRQADGSWRYQAFDGLNAEAALESIGIAVPLAEIALNRSADDHPACKRPSNARCKQRSPAGSAW